MKPVGEMFSQFQNTFGQSWLLLTNPVGYAKMITEGTYTTNPLGPTGAYGLEIDRFDVQSIYPEEPFMISINLANKGTFEAKNVKLALFTTITGVKLSYNGKELKMTKGKNYDYNQDIYIYEMQLDNIEKQDVKEVLPSITMEQVIKLGALSRKYVVKIHNVAKIAYTCLQTYKRLLN
jgi:hypothetical protein